MKFEQVKTFIINILQNELSPGYTYHNLNHTLSVIERSKEIAEREGIEGEDLFILLTAALFHDFGFIEASKGHEKISCNYARKYLPDFDYTPGQIETICNLIIATEVPQRPVNKLSEILCDADLYYLGNENYFEYAENLFNELNHKNTTYSKEEWHKQQIAFLATHKYFTETTSDKLTDKQKENLDKLKNSRIAQPKIKHKEFHVKDILLIIVGVFIAAFALKGFLVPNNFFDGGVTGISLLIHEIYHFNLGYVIVIANLPLIVMAWYSISAKFALKTFFCVVVLGLCLLFLPYPTITSDKLLVSIFGGFFLGIGIGLTMRAGCAVDGIEVLAVYTWRRSSFTISEIILALNIIIFSIAAFRFGIQVSLYSMLTYFTASKTVDYVVEGIEAYTGVTIISNNSEVIKQRLVHDLGRGITVYKGEKGYLPDNYYEYSECDIIFTVITRLELRKLKNLVNEVDPKAFVFASTIKEASGGIIKRRHIH